MTAARPGAADLYLVGLGIGPLSRMTYETVRVIQACALLLHLTPHHDTLQRAFPGVEVSQMHEVYEASDDPPETYRRMTEAIVEQAAARAEKGQTTAFATYGHPFHLVDTSRECVEAAPRRGLRVRVVPAISSFDTLLIDSPASLEGVGQYHEATDFLRAQRHFDAGVPLVLWQIGTLGATALRSSPDEPSLQVLADRLSAVYGGAHHVHAVVSPWRAGMAVSAHSMRLDELPRSADRLSVGATLVVPPAHDGPAVQ